MTTNFNTQVFNHVIDAATALGTPFSTHVLPSTADVYSYNLYSANQMSTNFGVTDAVWQYSGPILGQTIGSENYIAQTDCSGFVARVLNATVLAGAKRSVYAGIVTEPNGTVKNFVTGGHPQPFPSADDYAEFITMPNAVFFTPIAYSVQKPQRPATLFGSTAAAAPGDILAYGLPVGSKDTGHVMVITSVEQLAWGTQSPLWGSNLTEFTNSSKLQFYAIGVFDSSNVPHYQDHRGNAAGKFTGVGYGTILLVANEMGAPIGFMFNPKAMLLAVESIAYSGQGNTGQLGSLAIGRAKAISY